MDPVPLAIGPRDVFICFSKARPGEADVAIALKDELEQLGLFAFEYEDWQWIVATGDAGQPDVDRHRLQRMLEHCSVVIFISPHQGGASQGVNTELAELRALQSPVILLYWSPEGWHPLDPPPELAGLNIVWSIEGKSSAGSTVAENQCRHLARRMAVAAWTACHVRWAATDHQRTAGRLLTMIPEGPRDPLLNLRLSQPAVAVTEWPETVDIATFAARVVEEASDEDLAAFVKEWHAGSDLMAGTLAQKAQFELIAPVKTLHSSFDTLGQEACRRHPTLSTLAGDARRRGLMLVRLNRLDEAVPLLQQALASATDDTRYEILQPLAFALEDSDPAGSIECFTRAIACAPDREIACGLTYDRGTVKSKDPASRGAAIDDFSFVVDHAGGAALRHSALQGRARMRVKIDDRDGAIDDFSLILADADAAPRTAVSAWMDRGSLLHAQGRAREAIADWSRAIAAADAEPKQRFRTLEARAQALETLGERHAAADDYEAMTKFSSIDPGYRDELRRMVADLRRQPK